MVAEADESDRSFLQLSPTIAVVTNIDREHMDAYGSFDRLVDAFAAFADRVPFYGAVVACVDDAPVRVDAAAAHAARSITYGFADDADVRGLDPVTDGRSGRCHVRYRVPRRARRRGRGRVAAGRAGPAQPAERAGGGRRRPRGRACRSIGSSRRSRNSTAPSGATRCAASSDGVTVVDDYGHHPTEIAAVLRAARDGRPARLVAVFQPHRYTRTRDLLDDFGPALALADVVVLTDIYPAGEAPIPGITIDALADAVRDARERRATWSSGSRMCRRRSRDSRKPGDLVVTLGRRIDRRGAADRLLDGRCTARRSRHEPRRRAARGLPVMTAGVAAPADRRFRRPDVRPARRRKLGQLAWRAAAASAIVAGVALLVLARHRRAMLLRSPLLRRQSPRGARQRAALDRRGADARRRPARPEHLARGLRPTTASS